jgi:hypothetical protein
MLRGAGIVTVDERGACRPSGSIAVQVGKLSFTRLRHILVLPLLQLLSTLAFNTGIGGRVRSVPSYARHSCQTLR